MSVRLSLLQRDSLLVFVGYTGDECETVFVAT